MANELFKKTAEISIYPKGGWSLWKEEQDNMESLWHDVRAAALRLGFIKGTDLKAFQSMPRKPFGVKVRDFVGNVGGGRWTYNGAWLVAYPLLTADDETWVARLDVFYFFTDVGSSTYEYIKNPVLTIQHYDEEHDAWDHTSLAYDRKSNSLRLTPENHRDEIDLVRHTSIDIDKYKHKDIFPRRLTSKEKAEAEKADLMRTIASNLQEGQTTCKKTASEVSGGAQRKRPIIPEDSEDEHDPHPSGSSSSGHKAVATTAANASPEVSSAPGDGSSERNGQQGGDGALEKALRKKIKTLEGMVRDQGAEITELKLRLADRY